MEPNEAYMMLLDTLHRASSQDVEVLKPAEKQLMEWETEPGYYSLLLSIFSNHSIDANVRWLAVVTFKNAIDRYWRKNAPNGISEDEKRKLRQNILSPSLLKEPTNQVASQSAVLIGKIARFDCPHEWPELVPNLLTAMKMSVSLERHRAILIFHHVVKALSTKRLAIDRRIFCELTTTVFSYMSCLWDEYTLLFLKQIQLGATTESITESLENALYSLKVLKKLCLFGMKSPHENPDVMLFLNSIFDRAKTTLECRKLLKGRGVYLLEACEKFIIHLTKVALGTLESYPLSYISLISPSIEFTMYYCFYEHGMHLAFERFTVQCLNMLKAILLCREYKKRDEDHKDTETVRAYNIKVAILNEQSVRHLCKTLVTHFLLLSSDDLELWDSDSEYFAIEFMWGTWKYNLRPCVDSLFLAFLYEFRPIIVSEVLMLLKMIRQEPRDPNNLPTILRKDAIYNAAGQIATDLYDEVDFDEWYRNELLEELKINGGNYRIIRRRVAWLIGTWSKLKISPQIRPILYQSLLELLSEKEDMAVRLAACDALSSTVDDFDFCPEQFAPYVQPAFALLLTLLKEADECDTKMHVLRIISHLIERNDEIVLNHITNELLSYLPQLWEYASQVNMLRCAIVSNLVHLVKALGYWVTPEMQSLVLSILDEATNPKQPAYVYLLEEGLELWQAVLEVTPVSCTCADQLLHLSQNLPALLEDTTEYLRQVIYIAHAYILLMPVEFLKAIGKEFMIRLTDLLSDMQVEGMVKVYKLVELCLKIQMPEPNSMLGIEVIWPVFPKFILGSDPNETLSVTLLTLRSCLISRLLLKSFPLFLEAIKEAGSRCSTDPNEVLKALLDTTSENLNFEVQQKRKKLIGLGIGVLLTSQIPCVLERFSPLMTNITEVFNDVMVKNEQDEEFVDGLLLQDNNPPSPSDSNDGNSFILFVGTQHDERFKQLKMSDVVFNVDLKLFITNQLLVLQSQVGKKSFDDLISTVDTRSLDELCCYIPSLSRK